MITFIPQHEASRLRLPDTIDPVVETFTQLPGDMANVDAHNDAPVYIEVVTAEVRPDNLQTIVVECVAQSPLLKDEEMASTSSVNHVMPKKKSGKKSKK